MGFLKEMADETRLKLFQADLTEAMDGSYDAAFAGCACVFHVAADLGSDTSCEAAASLRAPAPLRPRGSPPAHATA